MLHQRAALLFATLAFATNVGKAAACAVCGCGDPTLTALGVEKPFRDRVRVSLEVRHRTDAVGTPMVNQVKLFETRTDLQAAWAPHERLFLLLTVPILYRKTTAVSLAEDSTFAFGDVELRAKFFAFEDHDRRHLLSVIAGAKLPSAPGMLDERGQLLPTEVQVGTGSFDPIAGVAYAYMPRPLSFYASLTGLLTTLGRNNAQGSRSLRATTTLQRQWTPMVATRIGIDARVDTVAANAGVTEPDSGGFIAFLTPEFLLSPYPDWLVWLSARVPVVNALSGSHHEGPVVSIGFARDF